MKEKGVCNGCKYHLAKFENLKDLCNYCEMTGRSRLVIERENGGYKKESCICYEAARRRGGTS